MVPPDIPVHLRQNLLHPDIMIPPLLWLVPEAAGGVTGSHFAANLWDVTLPPERAAEDNRARQLVGSRNLLKKGLRSGGPHPPTPQ